MDDFLILITIGILASVISALGTYFITTKKAEKDRERELLGWAMQAALKDFELKEKKKISSHLYFHYHWLHLVDKNLASEEALEELTIKAMKLNSIANRTQERFREEQE